MRQKAFTLQTVLCSYTRYIPGTANFQNLNSLKPWSRTLPITDTECQIWTNSSNVSFLFISFNSRWSEKTGHTFYFKLSRLQFNTKSLSIKLLLMNNLQFFTFLHYFFNTDLKKKHTLDADNVLEPFTVLKQS